MKIMIDGHEIEGTPEEIRKLLKMPENNYEERVSKSIMEWQEKVFIPPACRYCSNHPSNGGPGDCNCILGGYQFTC